MKSAFLLLTLALVCTMINCLSQPLDLNLNPVPLDPDNLDEEALAALKSAEPKFTLVGLVRATRKIKIGPVYTFSGEPLFFVSL